MKKKKILIVFGTRPEGIKMAPLVHKMRSDTRFETTVCSTGQHKEMLEQVMQIFDITPDINLSIMRHGQTLDEVTARILVKMTDILQSIKPDLVLVHGDTTTAMAAAISSFYNGTPVGHVEAGLRTFDLSAPFPEEFNRQVVTKVSSLHFAPTETSRANLIAEGVDTAGVAVTGNTVIDALFWMIEKNEQASDDLLSYFMTKLGWCVSDRKFVLITGHRRENFGDGFLSICSAIAKVAEKYPDIAFVYPVHLNPKVKEPVNAILGDIANVHLISPLEYTEFVFLLSQCHFVLTDSGGIQEEAPSLGKPVLVMRDVTERPEAVDAGTVKLVGSNESVLIKNISSLLDNETAYSEMSRAHNPYGDGRACDQIIGFIAKRIGGQA
ncbi:UDP-N-acetylglucosamine 2-epimerase (non-hydrolyzing) [Luminiphilus sp.]|nr:UDP-N-acetylglucosamine 2-epimerase (non-hydrolyzing) [Luminiphilus sp.]